ncbi:hypothetical protein CCACVL1_12712 [Corchorus capsularis]|uniref:Uncharacterized protein n=1 Tax=Corchorus capsularis TaxID=210143 RepID=A0A1R3IE69_COCAP|nr:hypothetical protein CCACVL1_12712 [Corchorus capsularis]
MDSKDHPFKVDFIPFSTPSHSRPLADRGCHVIIITTHYNSSSKNPLTRPPVVVTI